MTEHRAFHQKHFYLYYSGLSHTMQAVIKYHVYLYHSFGISLHHKGGYIYISDQIGLLDSISGTMEDGQEIGQSDVYLSTCQLLRGKGNKCTINMLQCLPYLMFEYDYTVCI